MKQSVFSLGRINSLSDGVFAIAMTLLVLDLKLPPLDPSAGRSVVTAALVEQLPRLICWILSFAILCRLWITHNGLLATGTTRSRSFMTWNLVCLGAVSFIPFPTSLLSERYDRAFSVFFFSATYAVAGLALAVMVVEYRKQLASAGALSEESSVARAVALILATAMIACLLALIRPWLGVLTWAVYPFTSALVLRGRTPRDSPAGDGS